MIPFRCDHCGKDLKVKDELAGKKVKCPGCQKPVGVPQPAASVSPPPAARDDERTLPPKAPSPGEERTLPPKNPKESLSDADAHTNLGAGQAESTQAFQAAGHSSELTDFLAPAQGPDEIGRLGGYRILKIPGHGGMGVVFQGEDPLLGRKVAIKAMLPHLAGSKSSQERFLREAKSAAALEHDHIVPIFHVAVDCGVPFIVMPFLQGEPLDERLKRDKVLPIAEVLRIGRETAKGLAAAHEKGLIHRDIKPANIWLEGKEGRVKILDFGLARAASETGLTQTGAIVGTPQYMAPEQAEGKKDIDHRCDLFSLGCVLYRMCSGELPFKGDSTLAIISALAMHKPKEPSKVNKSVPQPLSNLIMHLLAKSPDDRPQSAQEVADALAQLSAKETAQMPAKAGKTTLFQKPPAAVSRRKWTLVGGGILGLAVLGLVVYFLASRERQRPENDSKRAEALSPTFTNSLGMEFVLVPKRKSWLGGGGGKPGDKEVEITEDFYLGKYEVTQEEWEKVMGKNPSHFSRTSGGKDAVKDFPDAVLKRFPVEMVSWDDAQLFLGQLNKQDRQAGWLYRLPKEVEWEYACRGGPMSDRLDSAFDFYVDKPLEQLQPEQANYEHDKGLKRACQVGSYKPNRLGLYDMHGNVAEWCDEKGVDGPLHRAYRGGGWYRSSSSVRAALRHGWPPSKRDMRLGFRLARVPVDKDIVKIITPESADPDRRAAEWVLSGFGVTIVNDGDREFEVRELAKLPKGPFRLIFCNMSGNDRLSDEGLSHFKDCKNLKTLQMIGSSVRDAWLVHFKNCANLAELNLSGTSISSAGLAHFKDCKALAVLVLDRCPITDASFPLLCEWTNLVSLHLKQTQVTAAKIKELAKVLPNCTIESDHGTFGPKRQGTSLKLFKNTLGMEFVLVPKGKSWLGGGGGNPGDKEVEIMEDFYLGKYEVTQEEWEKVTGLNPSSFKAVAGIGKEDQKRFPVENVSWDDCQLFIERLNKQVKDADWVYRLPTELEWEYACRGGPMHDKFESAFDFYFDKPTSTLLPDQANIAENNKGLGRTCKVGSYQPTKLGLYDMYGNAWEWCHDEMKDDKGASVRGGRGGGWDAPSYYARASYRFTSPASRRVGIIGLRLARVPADKDGK